MVYKRDFLRKSVQLPVTIKIKNKEANKTLTFKEKGLISDISVGGIFVLKSPAFKKEEINSLIKRKSKLYVEFFLPNLKIPIITTGRLRWLEDSTELFPKVNGMGIEFYDISKEDILEIVKYVSREITDGNLKKREFLRLPADIPIVFKRGAEAVVTDINIGGICLTVKPSLGKRYITSFLDKNLKIKLRLYKQTMSVIGKVRWAKNIKKDNISKLGIQFTQINSKDRRSIIKFMLSMRNI